MFKVFCVAALVAEEIIFDKFCIKQCELSESEAQVFTLLAKRSQKSETISKKRSKILEHLLKAFYLTPLYKYPIFGVVSENIEDISLFCICCVIFFIKENLSLLSA